ncbi:MAG: tRNA pseudouridine(38-40) synthase TruA [Cyclobacteriaceae bacterium]|nr:tRNA pseudouridine(38-40) synthase TruA [Cyclobacteriaceae bacterium]MCH8515448.1 tRNA pseudouridine(38-40) synthase TruA [Cyclobacteriaceae bacterium]
MVEHRYFVACSYLGTAYRGWQKQSNAHSVQSEIESALQRYFGLEMPIMGSGRTDSGVHAIQQVFHFDATRALDAYRFLHSLNGLLPKDISFNQMWQVKPQAHARFDATERAYRYQISFKKNPFLEGQVCRIAYRPDLSILNQCCDILAKYEDFEAFSKVKTQTDTFICKNIRAYWELAGENLVFHIRASRFLRGMVRAVVGSMLEVGRGKQSLEDFERIIQSKDRNQAGASVAAAGLFLSEVHYPQEIFIQKSI